MDGELSPVEGDGRVFFRDIKPYAVVEDLDQLRGPSHGIVELSHSVLWAPGGPFVDLDEPGGLELAYRAMLAEGLVEDLVQVLNRERLIVAWADLMLPARIRDLWESRFPELRSDHTRGRGRHQSGKRAQARDRVNKGEL